MQAVRAVVTPSPGTEKSYFQPLCVLCGKSFLPLCQIVPTWQFAWRLSTLCHPRLAESLWSYPR